MKAPMQSNGCAGANFYNLDISKSNIVNLYFNFMNFFINIIDKKHITIV